MRIQKKPEFIIGKRASAFMDWRVYYEERKVTAEEAVQHIKSNNRITLGHACGEPTHLVEAMVANAEAYSNVEIFHMVAMSSCDYVKPGMESHFRHNANFVGASTRNAVNEDRADFTPCFFYQVPSLFHTILPLDVALVMVTPPNEDGMVSLGISVDYDYEAVMTAKLVIAQVNDQMPFTYGNLISVEEIDYFVEHSAPVLELRPPQIGAVEEAIGEHCASLIHHGDTLQLGIGAIPDAVLRFLTDKKDLGIHSEMFSDGVIDLAESGVINNKRKSLHPGKFVANFVMGTRRLYDFVDHNSDVLLLPVDYVNNPVVIAKNDNMVSINSCVQVDLMGQVCAESVGLKQISGVGGQVDFLRGAAMSKGGRSILAFPSTTAQGKISKIVPLLDPGAAVTSSRNDVDYIITEFGIAHLKGRTLKERAQALIKIAHPDFREFLQEEYQKRFPSKRRG